MSLNPNQFGSGVARVRFRLKKDHRSSGTGTRIARLQATLLFHVYCFFSPLPLTYSSLFVLWSTVTQKFIPVSNCHPKIHCISSVCLCILAQCGTKIKKLGYKVTILVVADQRNVCLCDHFLSLEQARALLDPSWFGFRHLEIRCMTLAIWP